MRKTRKSTGSVLLALTLGTVFMTAEPASADGTWSKPISCENSGKQPGCDVTQDLNTSGFDHTAYTAIDYVVNPGYTAHITIEGVENWARDPYNEIAQTKYYNSDTKPTKINYSLTRKQINQSWRITRVRINETKGQSKK